MKKFIATIVLFIMPVCVILIFNLIIDYRGYFHDSFSQSIINRLKSDDISIYTEPSLRKIKKGLILNKKDTHVNKIILGSSRTMHLGGNDSTILNISVPGAVFEDYVILLNLLDSIDVKFDTIVISAHPWLFNKNHGDLRFKTFNNSFFFDSMKYAFSWQYFWSNISPGKFKKWDGNGNDFVIYKNGTVRFNQLFREQTTKISDYVYNAMQSSFKDFFIIDNFYKKEFEKILSKLKNDHIVELVLLPYHPIVYFELIDRIPIVTSVEDYYYSLKDEKVIIFGSYNPISQNFKETDFYDANHMTEESLNFLYISALRKP